MDIGQKWTNIYAHYPDDETRAAQAFADFICWCQVMRFTKKQARRLVMDAAIEAGLGLPDNFFCLAFASIMPEFIVDLDEEINSEPPREPVLLRAGFFRSVIDSFCSDKSENRPLGTAIHALGGVFRTLGNPEILGRVIDAGEFKHSETSGRKTIRSDEFYTRAELVEAWGDESANDMLSECGYRSDAECIISGEELIKWQMRRLIWKAPDADDPDD